MCSASKKEIALEISDLDLLYNKRVGQRMPDSFIFTLSAK